MRQNASGMRRGLPLESSTHTRCQWPRRMVALSRARTNWKAPLHGELAVAGRDPGAQHQRLAQQRGQQVVVVGLADHHGAVQPVVVAQIQAQRARNAPSRCVRTTARTRRCWCGSGHVDVTGLWGDVRVKGCAKSQGMGRLSPPWAHAGCQRPTPGAWRRHSRTSRRPTSV